MTIKKTKLQYEVNRLPLIQYAQDQDNLFVVAVGISQATGMDPHDIAATLQLLNMVQKRDGK